MSKDNKLQLLSPLFLKYQTDFEKNSRSRVFAPLAEAYRKLGMTDKAMEILSQGIRFHPTYVMGYLGLAFCYYDLKQYNLAYSTLRPLTESNRDNLRLQKLFSDVCLELGRQEEALETLKYLLFINPRDKDVAESVARLERVVDDKYRHHHKPIIIPENELTSETREEPSLFHVEKLDQPAKAESNDFDDWMAVDLSHETKKETKALEDNKPKITTTSFDQWSVKKGSKTFENEAARIERSDEIKFEVEADKAEPQKEIVLDFNAKEEAKAPLVTHTLVDLYCGQGHIEKALEVLEKILLLNPNDQKTIKKIKEIEALVQPLEQYDQKEIVHEIHTSKASEEPEEYGTVSHFEPHEVSEEVTEEDGRRHLMSLIDEKLGPIEIHEDSAELERARLVEEKLTLFLNKIQKRALDYQGRV